MLAQPNDYRDWAHVEIQNTGYNGGPGGSSTREFGLENGNGAFGLKHFAVSWDEATGEVVVYENGIESTVAGPFAFSSADCSLDTGTSSPRPLNSCHTGLVESTLNA